MANVGSPDRALCVILVAVLVASPLVLPSAGFPAAWAPAAMGVVMPGAAPRFCPARMIFGIRNCPGTKA
ncbi:DUF2892 domain-containing protein [Rhodobacter sp. M37P]|uniref:DUF2892 domain-containing protein n=2 Tax=Rhodobacter calidifons TaxID=2715277 RepID=A0ABX0G5Z0_9RHOB|nr:DUF2892 domain-containing protein [Rhodobacter calidifons]